MTGKNQHVVPHEDGWAVKGAGNQRATSVHDTQQQAIDAAGRSRGTSIPNSSSIARMAVSVTRTATATIPSLRKAE